MFNNKNKLSKMPFISLIFIILMLFSIIVLIDNSYAYESIDDNESLKLNIDEPLLDENSKNIISPKGNTFTDIQDTIFSANVGDTIYLDKPYYYGENKEIYIMKPLHIIGSQSNHPILDGLNSSGIFVLQPGSEGSTIKSCNFINGKAHAGAAILIQSKNITVKDSVFKNNNARGGGAIYTDIFNGDINNGFNLSIINCNFISNKATIAGGAISAYGNLTNVKNCNFINNRVLNNKEKPQEVYGGAVQLGQDFKFIFVNCSNCTFINNSADTGYNNISLYSHGGAGCIREGVSYGNCIFINNSADQGGALTFHSSGVIENCTFINNSAYRLYGGAINNGLNISDDQFKIINSSFLYNHAPFGGAIQLSGKNISISFSNFLENYALFDGGAIYINSSDTIISDSIFKKNIVNVNGGAIYVEGYSSQIFSNEFIENEAIPDKIIIDDGLGGAIYINGFYSTIESNIFKLNTARNGSAIYFDKNGKFCKIIGNDMFNNQAWVYLLPINSQNILFGQDENVTIVIYGGNNIASSNNFNVSNAIYNAASHDNIIINNEIPYSYPLSTGEIYQDNREYNVDILVTLIYEDGTIVFNDTLKSGIYGNISLNIPNLKSGNYKVQAFHSEDKYYKAISNLTNFNVKANVDNKIMKNLDDTNNFNYHDVIVWHLNIINSGPSNASNVIVKDTLPEGLIGLDFKTNKGYYDFNSGLWFVGNLNLGESAYMDIICLINKTGLFINNASISSDEFDWDDSNNNDNASIFVNPAADLIIKKYSNVSLCKYGDLVEFTISVFNNGPDLAHNVNVKDILDDGLVWVSDNGDGLFNPSSGIWNIGELDKFCEKSLKIVCKVSRTGLILNKVSVSSDEFDWNYSNNFDNVSISVDSTADLIIKKSSNTSVCNYKDKIEFTITIYNNGPDSAKNIKINELLSSKLKYLYSNTSNGVYDYKTGIWKLNNLEPFVLEKLTIVCLVESTGIIFNNVSVTSDTFDNNLSNNNVSINISVNPAADLSITKTVYKLDYNYGDLIRYNVRVINNGPDSAENVQVREIMSPYLKYMSNNKDKGVYLPRENLWKIDYLGPGENANLNLTVSSKDKGNFSNTVLVNSTTQDPDLDNNIDSVSVNIKDINNSFNDTLDLNKAIDLNESIAKNTQNNVIYMEKTANPIFLIFIILGIFTYILNKNKY